jgi:hypothetical protein
MGQALMRLPAQPGAADGADAARAGEQVPA